ncbi:hypothetical protein RISK_006094 [Rhodopirellula islandica]|uniref:Uncharacterized protein n=1 Tax=Rhodopirellula islandica TaxID=595434 RepID=A0A0J1B530_RHOIS|nr:hypothetical protein RISK_006094 [Rhodopirellula islandica]
MAPVTNTFSVQRVALPASTLSPTFYETFGWMKPQNVDSSVDRNAKKRLWRTQVAKAGLRMP